MQFKVYMASCGQTARLIPFNENVAKWKLN